MRKQLKAEEDKEFYFSFYELESLQKDLERFANNIAYYLMQSDEQITPEVIEELQGDIESEAQWRASEWFEWYANEEAKEIADSMVSKTAVWDAVAKIKERKIESVYSDMPDSEIPKDSEGGEVYLDSNDFEEVADELDKAGQEYTADNIKPLIIKKLQEVAERS